MQKGLFSLNKGLLNTLRVPMRSTVITVMWTWSTVRPEMKWRLCHMMCDVVWHATFLFWTLLQVFFFPILARGTLGAFLYRGVRGFGAPWRLTKVWCLCKKPRYGFECQPCGRELHLVEAVHLLVRLRALKDNAHLWPLHRLSLYCICVFIWCVVLL